MAYSTNDDLINATNEAAILQLIDDENIGYADLSSLQTQANGGDQTAAGALARIDNARDNADELINTFLRGRQTIPLAVVPDFIKNLSIDLTIYNLYRRRMRLEMPDTIKELKTEAMNMLTKVQRGDLKISDSPQVQSGQIATNKSKTSKIFSDDVLNDF